MSFWSLLLLTLNSFLMCHRSGKLRTKDCIKRVRKQNVLDVFIPRRQHFQFLLFLSLFVSFFSFCFSFPSALSTLCGCGGVCCLYALHNLKFIDRLIYSVIQCTFPFKKSEHNQSTVTLRTVQGWYSQSTLSAGKFTCRRVTPYQP